MDIFYLVPVAEYTGLENPASNSNFDQINSKIVNNPYLSEEERADSLKLALNKFLNQQRKSKEDVNAIIREAVKQELEKQQPKLAPPQVQQPPPSLPQDTFARDVNDDELDLNHTFNNYFQNVKNEQTDDEDDYMSASSEVPLAPMKTPKVPANRPKNLADISESNILSSGKIRTTRTTKSHRTKGAGWIEHY